MSILTVDVGGANQTTLTCQKGGHAEPRRVGTKPIGFAGEETSSIRAELMVVPVILTELTPAQIGVLRTLFKNGAQVDCSGDVFNNASATVTCSGILSDDFLPAGPWFVGNLTLYEVGADLSAGGSGGTTTTPIYLGDNPGSSPGTQVASPDGNDLSGWAYYDAFPGVTATSCAGPSACAISYSLSPFKTWITPALAATTLFGVPVVVQNMSGGTGTRWATQAVYLTITVVRAGVDLITWQTDWSPGNGGFAGGDITMTGTASIVYQLQDGDQLRFDEYGRMGLNPGQTDDGSDPHQFVGAGYLGGGVYLCVVTLGGTVQKLFP